MYENTFNNIDNKLRQEVGIQGDLDYVEQTTWLLFLKYLSDYEVERRDRAELEGAEYASIIDAPYRWGDWAYPKDNSGNFATLQSKTFFGQEKKGLPFITGIVNMILHGIEAPNLSRTNSLNENVMDIQEKDRHDIILANPLSGGKERAEVQQNFPIPSGETAYLFLQHFITRHELGLLRG